MTKRQPNNRITLSLLAAALCFSAADRSTAQNYAGQPNEQDPPSRVARIAVAQGNISIEPAGVDQFSAAELNYPATAGDRIYADNNSLSELQAGGLGVRLGNGADLTITSLTDAVAQFGLAQGSIRVVTRNLYAPEGQQAIVEIDTPNGAILVQQPGDIRVDSFPQDDTTVVTVNSGAVQITGQGLNQSLGSGQAIRLAGTNPVYAEYVGLLPPDALDQFDQARERQRQGSIGIRNQYVDPEMVGAADLDQYGDWQPSPDYGPVWYPRNVAYGWTPYSVGHWAWIAPWGWTWVDNEPWGFAPFHYGRWNNFGGRWGWVPGPPPVVFRDGRWGGPPPRPVYSPALVAFVGGPNFSLSIGFGGGSGLGVTAWFPLGPREPYVPWYHTSPAYVNRVNITNIYNTNVTEIHNTYINRTTTVYNTTNITYVNRTTATVAVTQKDFAAGRPIAQAQQIKLDANTRQQLAQAPILPHPLVTPANAIAAPQAPARALPPTVERPVVETRRGMQRAGGNFGSPAPAGAQAHQPSQAAPSVAPQQVNRAAFPQQRSAQAIGTVPAPMPKSAPAAAPVQAARPEADARQQVQPVARPQTPPVPVAPSASVQTQLRAQPRPAEVVRPLQTVTPPQPRQPSFEQQRQAIQQVDPGRPLGPQQVNNLRQGKPAGPASQPEKVAHPPAAKTPPPAKEEPRK